MDCRTVEEGVDLSALFRLCGLRRIFARQTSLSLEPTQPASRTAFVREPLGNEPQKSIQSCNLFRLNNLRESEAELTLFHRFRSLDLPVWGNICPRWTH
jgi:hypothetical protein